MAPGEEDEALRRRLEDLQEFIRMELERRGNRSSLRLYVYQTGMRLRYLVRLRFVRPRQRPSPGRTPPGLVCGGLVKWLMRPADYQKYVVPQIADMHAEYFAALARADKQAARQAVWRGNWHALASWLWVTLYRLIARVVSLAK